MADVTDPEIRQAYDDVRDDKADTNWLLLQYTTDKGDKLALASKGSGVSIGRRWRRAGAGSGRRGSEADVVGGCGWLSRGSTSSRRR